MYTKEELEIAIKHCRSYKEVLNFFKMNASGGNYISLKKKILKWNIDISHFLTRKEICKIANTFTLKTLEEILVKNSSYTYGNNLKSKLYKAGLKKPECEECGQGEIWRNKKISMILDHIDGDHFNNEITNLKILCPNCNAATDTFAGKNRTDKKRNDKIKEIKKTIKNINKVEKNNILKQQILDSGINFSKRGWGVKLSKKINRTPQNSLRIVKELFPEILKRG